MMDGQCTIWVGDGVGQIQTTLHLIILRGPLPSSAMKKDGFGKSGFLMILLVASGSVGGSCSDGWVMHHLRRVMG